MYVELCYNKVVNIKKGKGEIYVTRKKSIRL